MKSPKRILVINPFGIGDVIFSTPLVDALKKNFPDSHIGYVCNKRTYEVIKTNPNINKVFIYEKDEYREKWNESRIGCVKAILAMLASIRREKFGIAIDLSLGYQYSFLLKLIGIKRRMGFNYRKRGKFLTDRIDIEGFNEKHVVEYYLDILSLFGIDPKAFYSRPRVYLTESDSVWAEIFLSQNGVSAQDLIVGVIPGCGASWGSDAKYRHWGRKEFAEVCDEFMGRKGAKVILFGDNKESEICADIVRMMKNEPVIACGKTTLRDFLGLLNRCSIIITNDGGPLHMAVATGRKTVSIFGPVDEKIYGPYPFDSNHAVVSRKDISCRPCYKKFKYKVCDKRPCLSGIPPRDILSAADALLSREK